MLAILPLTNNPINQECLRFLRFSRSLRTFFFIEQTARDSRVSFQSILALAGAAPFQYRKKISGGNG